MLINGIDFKELECQKYWTFTSSFKTFVISVPIKPGAIAFTRIFLLASSFAKLFVKPIIPAFDAE